MIIFNFVQTILRYAQNYTLTKLNDYTLVKGREEVNESTVELDMSLQPKSDKILRMLDTGDWDKANFIGFQHSNDNLPNIKDEMRGTSKGDLKCVGVMNWEDYGVYVSGWERLQAYGDEEV